MAVEGVSSSNNNTTIIAGSTIVGAAGGGLIGYNTKPWLKDDAPNDSFIKKVEESIKAGLKKDQAKNDKIMALCDETLNNLGTKSVTVDDFLEFDRSICEIHGFDAYKKNALKLIDVPDLASKISATKNYDEITSVMKPILALAEKGELQDLFEDMVMSAQWKINPDNAAVVAKGIINESFNATTKKFVGDDEITKSLNKVAKNMQGKAALIWGAAGALVLGLGAFAATAMTSKKSAPETPAETQEKPKDV